MSKSEPVELIVSASSMKEYLTCEYKYLLSSVWRVPGAPNIDMAIGTAVHAGAEALHKGLPDPVEAITEALGAEAASMAASAVLFGAEPPNMQKMVFDSLGMYEVYRDKVAPTFTVAMNERSFVTRLNGMLFAGQIDRTDANDAVRDLKTTASLTKFRPERHRVQLTGYRFGFKSITGRWPTRLLLDVVTRNLKWKTVEVQPDEDEFITALTLAHRGIIAQEFNPTGASTGACARCPYALEVCTYARLD